MKRLKEIAYYVTDKINVSSLKTKEYITTDNMLPNRGGVVDIQTLPQANRVTKYNPGDILVSNIRPYFKKIWYATQKGGCSNDVIVFRISKDSWNSKFLYYVLSQDSFFDFMMAGANGTKMPRGNKKTIPDFLIPDFEPTKQIKIANILSAYDSLIENNQKQIKLLEEAAQRLYKEWFVDLRFPGYENTKIIDGVPEGWEKKSILNNNIFQFAQSKVISFDGEKKYYATADVDGTIIKGNGEYITFLNKPSRAAIQPIINSVWFARMSNSFKILSCYGESSHLAQDSIISSGFAGFTSLDGCFGFVYATVASKSFDEEKNRYATGATQVSLTNEGLKKIKILIPSVEIIRYYSKIIEPYLQKSELHKKNIIFLQQARDRLLPKLMNGEIEV